MTNEENIKKICNALSDDISRDIFMNRYFFSITDDERYIDNIVKKYVSEQGINRKGEVGYLLRGTENYSLDKELIIYGCGKMGKKIYDEIGDCVTGFCDKNEAKQQEGFCGKKVLSPNQLIENKEKYDIIIASINYYEEIYKWVQENKLTLAIDNFDEIQKFKSLIKEQYFAKDIIKYGEDEVFVDGGSLNYSTSLQFLQECSSVKKIYAFEPDPDCVMRCRKEVKNARQHDYEIVEKGLYKKSAELYFRQLEGGSSGLDESGDICVKVCALDCEIIDKVTFIKMDIEGAELDALEGAKQTIKKYKPKLAICVYHKPTDIIDIPSFILSINPEYKLYLRHYSAECTETVLYAV